MTNEEKAKEIEEYFETPNPKEATYLMCYLSALKMAEWKDAQFKEYIEAHKQPVLASETDDTVVGYSIDADRILEWLKSKIVK